MNPKSKKLIDSACDYAGFAEHFLGKKFYPKQRAVLEALNKPGAFVSAAFCNGGGKTREVILSAVLGHLVLKHGRAISTSGSFRQIKDQLTPALKAYEGRFPGFRFLDNRIETRDPNVFWDGFSTNEAGRFEGHHGSESSPLLLIVDEAKTVKDAIFQAIDRCRPPREFCRVLFMSSPGYAAGEFYRSQIHPENLTHPPIKQRSSECPHITPEEIEADRKKWGENHPLFRSMHQAEFMPFVEGAIVQIDALDSNLAEPPPFKPTGQRKAFCDFAWSDSASGDENVLALRDGNRVTLESCFRAKGLHAVAGRFIAEFIRLGLKSWEIEGDADGEGANIIKQLRDMGWPIGSAHNGNEPRFNSHYANLAAEMWCEGAQAIIRGEFILPDDADLYGQMLDRKIVPHHKGLLAIESKIAMKDPNREGGPVQCSPDRADAVFGCMAPMPLITGKQVMDQGQPLPHNKGSIWGEREVVEPRDDYGVIPGIHFG